INNAITFFKSKNQDFKVELLTDLKERGTTKVNPDEAQDIDVEIPDNASIYKTGDFVDLCRGPHLENVSEIGAFKLWKLAGAYWRGDEKRPMLQRIYGTVWSSKKELKTYLHQVEEAKKRDHRKLGKEMDLFSFQEEAPGMPFFHHKGTFIWNSLVSYVTDIMVRKNYEINKTPFILNKSLWLQSGHWDHYKNNMYFTKIDEQDFAVKPMNCPGNILVYKTKQHSYRELPIRAGEFGLVHRHELSGVLSGLFRVRCFTQDDAHVFCTKEQMKAEIKDLIDFMDEVYSRFGFQYKLELSTRPEKAMGSKKIWDLAEDTLKEVLIESKKKYKINEGDGAFYGPKIDFHLTDAIGRDWQCGTIQLDFQMPEKFDMTYIGEDNQKHCPVMIHRAILGSVERFLGVLVEHFAGHFPLWIAPVQIKIIPIREDHYAYANKVQEILKAAGLRSELDVRDERMQAKIRVAQLEKAPYMIIIGDKEVAESKISIRTKSGKNINDLGLENFIEKCQKQVQEKSIELDETLA
ncbi:threonine--tRNA ligase, partial [bacterium]|nr:threonine--tRNA ligase [bacterium]